MAFVLGHARGVLLIVDRCDHDRNCLESELRATASLRVATAPKIGGSEPCRPDYLIVGLSDDAEIPILLQARRVYGTAATVVVGPPSTTVVFAAGRAGATAFLPKPASAAQILAVFRGCPPIHGGGPFRRRADFSGAALDGDFHDAGLLALIRSVAVERALTPREVEILTRAARGKSTKEVAGELRISPKTVEFFWSRLYDKLACRSQLAAMAVLLRAALDGNSPGSS